MKYINNQLHLSATDLSNHLGRKHLTQLELKRANRTLTRPERHNALFRETKQINKLGSVNRYSGHSASDINVVM